MNGFSQAVSRWQVRPFVRGESDCCAFVDFIIHELSGKHYLPDYGENWTEILDEHGSFENAVTHYLGCEPHDDARPGNVVLLLIENYLGLGFMVNHRYAASVFENGMVRHVPAKYVTKAWSWA